MNVDNVLILISALFGYVSYKWISIRSEAKNKNLMIKNYEKDMQLMAVELKGIMSLNKMCIEKWEKSVLDNTNLNHQNLSLIRHVNTLETKLSSQ